MRHFFINFSILPALITIKKCQYSINSLSYIGKLANLFLFQGQPMEYLDINHPEWQKMWDELASCHLNGGDPLCIHGNHCWEYMGSTTDHHHLRHASHPVTNKTEYMYIERAGAALRWA